MSDFPEKDNINEAEQAIPESNINEEEFSSVFADPTEHKKKAVKQKKSRLPAIIASVLAVAVLAGGTVAVVKLIPEREEESTASELETVSVLDMESDDFKTVTVTNKNGIFKLYSVEEEPKTDSSDSSASDTSGSEPETVWYLDGYDKEVISSSLTESIVSSTAKIEATREITSKSAADCGLASPEIKADIVTKDGAELSVLVGSVSPDNTGTYIKLSTDDKIYITDSGIEEELNFDALSLAATDSIEGITVTDDMKDYTDDNGALSSFDTITLAGTNYPEKLVLAPNTDKNLSEYATYMTVAPTKRIADNVDAIFDLFKSGVSVSGAYSFDTSSAALKKLGLDKPELTAEIKIGKFSLTYSFKLQEDGNYAVWYKGCKLIKSVPASSLSFIDYKVNDYYASWVCLQSINELSNFTVKTPEKSYSFDIVYDDSEDAEETYVITYGGEKLVAQNFQNFYQECIALSCTDYTVDNIKGDPDISIVFTYSDTARNPSTVEFRKSGAAKYQYRIDGVDMGKVNSSAMNKILKHVEKVANGEAIG